MKKGALLLMLSMLMPSLFASDGCTNHPTNNNGYCTASVVGGEVKYYCIDSTLSKNCVQGSDVDEG